MIEDDTTLPPVELKRAFDNAAEMTEFWSFLQDPRNEWAKGGQRWMWDRMNKEEVMKKKFRKVDSGEVLHREQITWDEKGVEDWFRKAISISQPEIVGRTALEYVNRRETGESKNERPFYAKQKVGTIRKYTDVWVKILRYIWRTSQWEKEARPKYTFTSNQQRCLHRMRRIARQIADDEEEEGEEGTQQPRAEVKKKRNQAIKDQCLQFWITMFDHALGDTEYDSAIISGIAVLGLDTAKWPS